MMATKGKILNLIRFGWEETRYQFALWTRGDRGCSYACIVFLNSVRLKTFSFLEHVYNVMSYLKPEICIVLYVDKNTGSDI